VDWIHVVQDKDQCLALMSMVINRFSPKLFWTLFKNSGRTAKKTPHFTVTKINRLTLFKEIIAVYSENRTKRIKWRVTDC
jgi:hypothetical protein